MRRTALATALLLALPGLARAAETAGAPTMNLGQWCTWIALFASLVSACSWLAVTAGRERALPVARTAFIVQWLAMLGGAVFLWSILFHHDFSYQYVHDYSSKAMPTGYVFAAFWGGQEGTFLLWGLLSATLGLVLMRWKSATGSAAMFFLNLPVLMLTWVTVIHGPFAPARELYTDGQGLNPLLQDYWMTIHPPVLFTGFSSFVVPFAIACAALLKRDYDGWVKAALPWVVFSTAIQATGFIMGGVWAYKVLGWGGYWGWDPVENGSLIPWLCNIALLHGLLVQRVTGSLRRMNFFLAITSYVLVLYASFLTRSGVLSDFSVHSFAPATQILFVFLVTFIAVVGVIGYSLFGWRYASGDIPGGKEPLGSFGRESFMWLGQLVFMFMCGLIALGMSAPLITKLFGPPANVDTKYYNLVNAPLAVAMGLLLGLAPLLRWRRHELPQRPQAMSHAIGYFGVGIGLGFMGSFLLSWLHVIGGTWPAIFGVALLVWIVATMAIYVPATIAAVLAGAVIAGVAIALGVRDPMPAAVIFAMAFALASNFGATIRGFRASWKHGLAYMAHMGAAVMLIGVIASSKYGQSAKVQLPQGEARNALGYRLTFQGMKHQSDGKDLALIAVVGPDRSFIARTRFFQTEQGWMRNPHIERFVTRDLYISPQEMVGDDAAGGVTFAPGDVKQVGAMKYTFQGYMPEPQGGGMKLTALFTAEIGGRTVPLKPSLQFPSNVNTPDYIPGGGEIRITKADAQNHTVSVALPGQAAPSGQILAVEVSTKPFINLVWLGAIVMLASAFVTVVRRGQDLARA